MLLFCFFVLIGACKEKEIYPAIPSIQYKSAYFISGSNGKDSLMKLIFTFKDGDGDIGLKNEDTLSPFNPVFDSTNKSLNPYYFNLYVNYTHKINGVFEPFIFPFTTDSLNYQYRIQYLTPDGRHKAIRGDIEVMLVPAPIFSTAIYDTAKYSFYIYDRALNKSNNTETPPLVWRR